MSRVYTVSFIAVAVTVQQDFFELVAAAGRPIRPLAIFLSQNTELGDASEEQLQILVRSGQTTSGSGGSAPTPVPQNINDAAAAFTAEVNNTTRAAAGTIVTHHADNWNVRYPWSLILPEKLQQELAGGRRWTVELATTPADSITISGTVYVEEFG